MSPVGVTLKINHLQQCRWFFRVLFSARFPSVYAVCVNQCVNRIFPMNTTIEAVLYTSKTLSNGQHPIMLRLTKNRKGSTSACTFLSTLNFGTLTKAVPSGIAPTYGFQNNFLGSLSGSFLGSERFGDYPQNKLDEKRAIKFVIFGVMV